MKRPTWNEVLAEWDLFSLASEFAYDDESNLRWLNSYEEMVADLSPDERRVFALFCLLAERGGR